MWQEDPNETLDDDIIDYIVHEHIIFLIDYDKRMQTKYLSKCLETYQKIAKKKCSSNKQDHMGIILYNTKKSNTDGEHVMTLQKFDLVTVDTLKNVKILLQNIDSIGEPDDSGKNSSPLDALTYALQILNSSQKEKNVHRKIILCTCNDNPVIDTPERHRIENLVSTFKDNKIKLMVVGFQNSWKDEIFYKDLQIISKTFTEDSYRRICLDDLEYSISYATKSVCKVPWKFSPKITIEVSIKVINSSVMASLPKINVLKKTNEPVDVKHIIASNSYEDFQPHDTVKEKDAFDRKEIIYSKKFGGSEIDFTANEMKKFKNCNLEPAIEILGFSPVMCDPIMHRAPAHFLSYTSDCNEESRDFFSIFVSRCASKKVMATCKVITKAYVSFCNMIPSEEDGGFYMYRLPFKDEVRFLDTLLQDFIYNSDKKCDLDETTIPFFMELMKMSKFEYSPKLFSNPKFDKCVAHIEALALEDRQSPAITDTTLPKNSFSSEVVEIERKLIKQLNLKDIATYQMAQQLKRKRTSNKDDSDVLAKINRYDFQSLAENDKLGNLTVPELKAFLAGVRQPFSGTKPKLISNIKAYYGIS
ncbi:X-ray repair cross-complementing protein 6-like [Trichogramma pretiosum]|uniref:X-ray repair cross-complementing protein 6-like n=1 Tax=Trichogramma pretiosum TaxID=7493 RepID=UPI0006C9A634|nr:X-ray repair cross-complementing protein 6-like [Trichogramma pretiosum]